MPGARNPREPNEMHVRNCSNTMRVLTDSRPPKHTKGHTLGARTSGRNSWQTLGAQIPDMHSSAFRRRRSPIRLGFRRACVQLAEKLAGPLAGGLGGISPIKACMPKLFGVCVQGLWATSAFPMLVRSPETDHDLPLGRTQPIRPAARESHELRSPKDRTGNGDNMIMWQLPKANHDT